jgi:hypothetical protein
MANAYEDAGFIDEQFEAIREGLKILDEHEIIQTSRLRSKRVEYEGALAQHLWKKELYQDASMHIQNACKHVQESDRNYQNLMGFALKVAIHLKDQQQLTQLIPKLALDQNPPIHLINQAILVLAPFNSKKAKRLLKLCFNQSPSLFTSPILKQTFRNL